MATLGKVTPGTGTPTILQFWCAKFTAIEDGTATSITCQFRSTGVGVYKLCVWSDNGSGNPGPFLAASAEDSMDTSVQTKTLAISFSFTAGQNLYFGIVANDWTVLSTVAGSTNQFTQFTQDYTTYPTIPNPATIGSQSATEPTIYITYTPSGPPSIPSGTIKGVQSFKGVQSIKF